MESNSYGQPAAPGDPNDFFGGTVVPHASHTKEYADFSVPGPAAPSTTKSKSVVWYLLAIPVALVVVAGAWVYGVQAMRTSIELPDTLLGMERIDPESALGREIEDSFRAADVALPNIDLEVAGYTSGSRMLVVAAAEAGGTGDVADDYFAGIVQGMQTGLPGVRLEEADAGRAGGRMQCMQVREAAAGMCAWIAEDTVGVVVDTGSDAEAASTTIAVRDEIEQ